MEHLSVALGLWLFFYGMLAYTLFIIVASWVLNVKAGEPGWAAIIPIYNTYVLDTIAGKPGWWLILWFIPFVNFVVAILVLLAIAEKFGKGVGYGLGLVFLGFIFLPLLAFGDAEYEG
jgi:hypothetical protein